VGRIEPVGTSYASTTTARMTRNMIADDTRVFVHSARKRR